MNEYGLFFRNIEIIEKFYLERLPYIGKIVPIKTKFDELSTA